MLPRCVLCGKGDPDTRVMIRLGKVATYPPAHIQCFRQLMRKHRVRWEENKNPIDTPFDQLRLDL